MMNCSFTTKQLYNLGFTLTLCSVAFTTAFAQNVIFVRTGAVGTNTGTSWTNAYTSLQSAIAAAVISGGVDTIKVAAGTYKPAAYPRGGADASGNPLADVREYTFHLPTGTVLWGGYTNSPTASNHTRNAVTNLTKLSGDNGVASDQTDNVYHIMTTTNGTTNVRIDGFTVERAQADGGSYTNYSNLYYHYQNWGGGLYAQSSSPIVSNCIFQNNFAHYGGALFAEANAAPAISSTTFQNNRVASSGGACYMTGTSPAIFTSCTFNSNLANYGGGAIANYNSSPNIITSTISNNKAQYGGGIYNDANSAPTVRNCAIVNNLATVTGGGISGYNSIFAPSYYGCVITGNSAGDNGGAVYAYGELLNIVNCTIVDNSSSGAGHGGIYATSSTLTVKNSILWANGGEPIFDGSGNTINVTYSTLQTANVYAGTGNSNANPQLMNLYDGDGANNTFRNGDDGFRLRTGSPCVNSGNNADVPPALTTDIMGGARTQTVTVDRGAYEGAFTPTCSFTNRTAFVAAGAAGANNGTTWANAYTNLQTAIAAVLSTGCIDTLKVAQGTYKPSAFPRNAKMQDSSVITDTRHYTFHIPSNLTIIGSYATSGVGIPNINVTPTILSGDLGVVGDSIDNAYHVVLVTDAPNVGLQTLRIERGTANGTSTVVRTTLVDASNGGGLYMAGSPLAWVIKNRVQRNSCYQYGGGVYMNATNGEFSSNTITANTGSTGGGWYATNGTNINSATNIFSKNNGTYSGGGMCIANLSAPNCSYNVYTDNKSPYGGGAYINYSAGCLFSFCDFINNNATNGGGAYISGNTNTAFSNCAFERNNATSNGGGIYESYSGTTVNIYSSAFTQNTALVNGGAINTSGNLNATNCSFVNNNASAGATMNVQSNAITNINNSIIWGSLAPFNLEFGATLPTLNNCYTQLSATTPLPKFLNINDPDGADNAWHTADDGLKLRTGSPCIDAGNNTYTNTSSLDMTYTARTQNATIDIGAYEGGSAACAGVRTVYVDGTLGANGTGATWATAFNNLQSAIDAALTGCGVDTVKIANATYKPSVAPRYATEGDGSPLVANSRNNTFHLPSNIVFMGGYASGGASRSNYNTIWSGDIGTPNDSTDNTYHVATMVGAYNTVLDHIHITRGHANGSSILMNGTPIEASYGAGLCAYFSSGLFTESFTDYNRATSQGGGVYLNHSNDFLQNASTYNYNSAYFGGGATAEHTNTTFTGCSFLGNRDFYEGGGLAIRASIVNLTNCAIANNNVTTSGYGAGLYSVDDGKITLSQCNIYNNKGVSGGGIYAETTSVLDIDRCRFYDNKAISNGGSAIAFANSSTDTSKVRNSIFFNNIASQHGTIFQLYQPIKVTNCTFANNVEAAPVAAEEGVIYQAAPASLDINNTIIWGTNGAAVYTNGGPYTGANNILQGIGTPPDPQFLNINNALGADAAWNTADDGLQVRTTSPALNAGNNVAITGFAFDVKGAARVQNTTVDMGAYEGASAYCDGSSRVVYVDSARVTNGNGLTWATAFNNLQSGIDAVLATCADTIKVAKGSYLPSVYPRNIDNNGAIPTDTRYLTFHLPSNVVIIGGYPTGGGARVANLNTNKTRLSGNIGNPALVGDNTRHVVLAIDNTNVYLDRLYIEDGVASGPGASLIVNIPPVNDNNGGGIYASNAKITLKDCAMLHDSADVYGGGICAAQGSVINSTNIVINFCGAAGYGGGIALYSSSLTFPTTNNISYCKAGGYGGAIYASGSALNMLYGTFRYNRSGSGGGIYLDGLGTTNTLDHCVFTGNVASTGGGIVNYSGNVNYLACFFQDNYANTGDGGAMYNYGGTNICRNATFHRNHAYQGGAVSSNGGKNTYINNVFYRNIAFITGGTYGYGGGLYVAGGDSTYLYDNTFARDTAFTNGGGIFNASGTVMSARNNVVWGNTNTTAGGAAGIANDPGVVNVDVQYSTVQGGYPGTGNLSTDPLFADINNGVGLDGLWTTYDDGLQLQCSSPARNSGNNASVPTGTPNDYATNPRIQDGTVDRGAYEGIIYVANVTANRLQINCANPTATLTAATGANSWLWSNGQTTAAITVGAAGTYTVTATQTLTGCTSTGSITITDNFGLPSATLTKSNDLCAGGTTMLTAGSGNTYTFSAGTTAGAQPNLVTVSAAGIYTVTVTGVNGCTATASVTVTAFPAITFPMITSTTPCQGTNTGSVTATIAGGTPPFTYSWSNGVTGATTINNIAAGTYTITVTDANGCTKSASLTISAYPLPTITITGGGSGGCPRNVTASGGFSYLWSNGANTAATTFATSGTYTVTVTSTNGCVASSTVVVTCVASGCAYANSEIKYQESTTNKTVYFYVPTTTGCTGSKVYNWTFPGGTPATLTTTTAAPGYVAFATNGTKNVCVTTLCINGTDTCRTQCCKNILVSDPVDATMNPAYSFSMGSGGSTYSIGTFSNPAGVGYNWTVDATSVGTGTTPAPQILPLPTSVVSTAGAHTMCLDASRTGDNTINRKICKDFTLLPSTCLTATARFSATVTPSGANFSTLFTGTLSTSATTYAWKGYAVGAGTTGAPLWTSALASPTFVYTATGVYWICLTINAGTPCETTTCMQLNLNSNTCNSVALPCVASSTAIKLQQSSTNQTVYFYAPTTTGCTGSKVYNWTFAGGSPATLTTVGTAAPGYVAYAAAGLKTICVTTLCINGTDTCRTTCCKDIFVADPNLGSSNPAYSLSMGSSGSTYSIGTFTNPAATGYTWDIDGMVVGSGTTPASQILPLPTTTISTAGAHTLCLTTRRTTNGQTSDRKICKKFTLLPSTCLTATARFAATVTTTGSNHSVAFNGTLSASATTYAWKGYAAGANTSTAPIWTSALASPTIAYAAPGVYWICLTINAGTPCETTTCMRITLATAACANAKPATTQTYLSDNATTDLHNDVIIYPNPTTNGITIATDNYNVPMRLYDLRGVLLQHTDLTPTHIDLSDYAAGMYLLYVGNKVIKVIRE
jgi:hypothetical protein